MLRGLIAAEVQEVSIFFFVTEFGLI